MNRFFCLGTLAALALLPLTAFAEGTLYGIYSNMASRGGEPSGVEVFILPNGKPGKCSDSVLLQVAEGWPQAPELVDCCACSPAHVEFPSQRWGRFVGLIESDTLVGEFIETQQAFALKRGRSVWQK